MNILYDEQFRELSGNAMDAIKIGDFASYSAIHKQMAEILHREKNYDDELKSRMIAYYCDLSGVSNRVWIDRQNVAEIVSASLNCGMAESRIHDIFFGAIRKDMTPRHTMTVKGSYKLLTFLMNKKDKKVNSIVENLR